MLHPFALRHAASLSLAAVMVVGSAGCGTSEPAPKIDLTTPINTKARRIGGPDVKADRRSMATPAPKG